MVYDPWVSTWDPQLREITATSNQFWSKKNTSQSWLGQKNGSKLAMAVVYGFSWSPSARPRSPRRLAAAWRKDKPFRWTASKTRAWRCPMGFWPSYAPKTSKSPWKSCIERSKNRDQIRVLWVQTGFFQSWNTSSSRTPCHCEGPTMP